MRIPVHLFTRPSNLALFAAALSFGAWVFPSFGVLRKGFEKPAALDPIAILVLAAWYALIFVSFRIGEFLGKPHRSDAATSSATLALDSNLTYLLFTIIAAVGVLAVVIKIFGSLSLAGTVDFVLSGQANEMRDAIYQEYRVGLLSLRYIVIYPAAIAVYRLVSRRSLTLSIAFNIVLLLVSALVSFRLALVATAVTAFLLLNYNIRYRKIRITSVLLVGTCLFSLLAVFNYSRNYGFYEERDLSFWSSGFAEMITYLGGPFQVALGTAARTGDLVSGQEESYRELVDVEEQLNRPSAFVTLHQQMGYLCWLYIAAVCGIFGFVYSHLVAKGKTAYLLPCGVILYASAELWRVNLFGQGIFIALMVIGTGIPWLLSFVASWAAPDQLPA